MTPHQTSSPALRRAFDSARAAQRDLALAVQEANAARRLTLMAQTRHVQSSLSGLISIMHSLLHLAELPGQPAHSHWPGPAGVDALYLLLYAGNELAEDLGQGLRNHGCEASTDVCPACAWDDLAITAATLSQSCLEQFRLSMPGLRDLNQHGRRLIGMSKGVISGTVSAGPLLRGNGTWRGEPLDG